MEKITCTYANEQTLYLAYMPYINTGGLFIRVKPRVEITAKIGDMVELAVVLPDGPNIYEVSGKVVWITPVGAQGGHPAGYGVALLGEAGANLKNRIVKQLAPMLKPPGLPTDTM